MKKLTLLALFVCFSALVQAQDNQNLSDDNLAIQGYDVISYFDGAPKEGDKNISFEYAGAQYFFTSEANKNKFKTDPAKYAPQYGGWCAYAMGVDGSKVKIDPDTYTILDNKLYLFYNFGWTNTLPKWKKDEANLKTKADDYWAKQND